MQMMRMRVPEILMTMMMMVVLLIMMFSTNDMDKGTGLHRLNGTKGTKEFATLQLYGLA